MTAQLKSAIKNRLITPLNGVFGDRREATIFAEKAPPPPIYTYSVLISAIRRDTACFRNFFQKTKSPEYKAYDALKS
jgi:hypothetical protein